MSDTPHLGFIVAAYALAAAVILGMIAGILYDYRSLRTQLRALEASRGEGSDT
jgi:heme exporter protein CcmD